MTYYIKIEKVTSVKPLVSALLLCALVATVPASAEESDELFSNAKREALNQENHRRALAYLDSLAPQLRSSIEQSIGALAPLRGLHEVQKGSEGARVFVMVHGLSFEGERPIWAKPLVDTLSAGATTYFFRWEVKNPLRRTAREFAQAMARAAAENPGRKIEVVGYCVGGVIALMALDELIRQGTSLAPYSIHTIASPFNGYAAPSFSIPMGYWAGQAATIEIGYGTLKRLRGRPYPNCHHWINTSCARDVHACRVEGRIPQILDESELPCGPGSAERFDDQTHSTILWRVVERLVSP